jgi:hypothetical protein
MKNRFYIIFTFATVVFPAFYFSCTNKKVEKPDYTSLIRKDSVPFDQVIDLDYVLPDDDTARAWINTLSVNETGSEFTFHLSMDNSAKINFENEYDGPGFSPVLLRSREDPDYRILLIEAQADFGTAFYYLALLDSTKLLYKAKIAEPRANGETTKITDFITIWIKSNQLVLRFKKDAIADYSGIPSKLKSDDQYVYSELDLNAKDFPDVGNLLPAIDSGNPVTKRIYTPEQDSLQQLFAEWRQNEISAGNFWDTDSCYPSFVMNSKFDGPINSMWGIPEVEECNFSYADLNDDGKTDQLVTFNPSQCDGGNASMWTQIQVLFLSGETGYTTEVSSENDFGTSASDDGGFYHYDSIGINKVYGTYYKFTTDDGHWCPGTIQPVIINYSEQKVIWQGENEAEDISR